MIGCISKPTASCACAGPRPAAPQRAHRLVPVEFLAAAGPVRQQFAARSARSIRVEARRAEERRVTFDDEGDDDLAFNGSVFTQVLSGLSAVANKLTNLALQFAPDVPAPAMRTAVSGAMLLLAVSFVKGIISFFLTLGTVALGAYVAVRVLGADSSGTQGSSNKRSSRGGAGRSPARISQPSQQLRRQVGHFLERLDPSSEEEESGLLDVWFEVGGSKKGGSKSKR